MIASAILLSRLSCHGRKHSQTIFTIEIFIKILAASTCMIDFFCKSMAASNFCDEKKSAFRLAPRPTTVRIRTQLSECREKVTIIWIASLISVVLSSWPSGPCLSFVVLLKRSQSYVPRPGFITKTRENIAHL